MLILVGIFISKWQAPLSGKMNLNKSIDQKNVQRSSYSPLSRSPASNKKTKDQNFKKLVSKKPHTNQPSLEKFPKVKIDYEHFHLVSNVVADFNIRPFNKITDIAGLNVYEANPEDKQNVLFDESRGLYCAWTGLITLSGDPEVVMNLVRDYPIQFQESVGPIYFFKSKDDFDLKEHLPKLLKVDGIGDISLDLNYSKLVSK